MRIDADDDILQDFLVEAGEILEQLGEQLIELERSPRDMDLLNSVFRGFHTVKGGAGFLRLEPMVVVCHRAEDVFNVLRNGGREVDSALMDAVLRVLDVVKEQFSQVSEGEYPTPVAPELISQLESYAQPDGAGAGAETPVRAGDVQPPEQGDAADEEFEKLLDDLHGRGEHGGRSDGGQRDASGAGGVALAEGAGEITDEEFERLLDSLHGPGQAPAGDGQDAPEPAEDLGAGLGSGETEPAGEIACAKAEPAGRQSGRGAEVTVRVDTRRLDEIMNMVGELVLVRNRLSTLKANMADAEASKAVANLDLVTADLQMAVMKTRMQPIRKVFGRFPRVVRDLARSLNKTVELEMRGQDTDLDKNLVEALADPLVHMVRNAVDHGIEAPEQREALGKPRAGKLVLAAAQEGDHILLTISDDGAGMDPELLRRKAAEKGIMDNDSAARLDDKDCYNLIFAPGFSTKAEISDISGRGVGMDVVKTRIAQLNGTIEIDSEPGKGSTLSVKLPLTLAILPTLMVKVGMRTFALPLSSVSEIFHLHEAQTNVVDGQLCVRVRKRATPLFYLREWLVRNTDENVAPETEQVVVAHVGNQKIGLVVNQVIGQEEVVIKPLGALLHGLPGLAGATITGDGRIALILDLPSLLAAYGNR